MPDHAAPPFGYARSSNLWNGHRAINNDPINMKLSGIVCMPSLLISHSLHFQNCPFILPTFSAMALASQPTQIT
jgi:hypothetical protein